MAFTGGELNLLNGKYGISAPHNSVPVMKLIRAHDPKTRAELNELINSHIGNNCTCGVTSKGTVEDFGIQLFNAQLKEWGTHKYTLEQCIQWEYDLFITQSLKGKTIEEKALNDLNRILKSVETEIAKSTGFKDEELRIDLLVKNKSQEICGIQVKPATFNHMRKGVILFNKKANEKWGKPVFYLFYDKNENWININEVTEDILRLL